MSTFLLNLKTVADLAGLDSVKGSFDLLRDSIERLTGGQLSLNRQFQIYDKATGNYVSAARQQKLMLDALSASGVKSKQEFQRQIIVLEQLRNAVKNDNVAFAQFTEQIARVRGEMLRLDKAGRNASTGLDGLGHTSGSASFALLSTSRIVQDANYGFIGMANNITQTTEAMVAHIARSGGFRAAMSSIGSLLLGPSGVIFAISTLVASFQFLREQQRKAGVEANKLKNIYEGMTQSIVNLTKAEQEYRDLSYRDAFSILQQTKAEREALDEVLAQLEQRKKGIATGDLTPEQYYEIKDAIDQVNKVRSRYAQQEKEINDILLQENKRLETQADLERRGLIRQRLAQELVEQYGKKLEDIAKEQLQINEMGWDAFNTLNLQVEYQKKLHDLDKQRYRFAFLITSEYYQQLRALERQQQLQDQVEKLQEQRSLLADILEGRRDQLRLNERLLATGAIETELLQRQKNWQESLLDGTYERNREVKKGNDLQDMTEGLKRRRDLAYEIREGHRDTVFELQFETEVWDQLIKQYSEAARFSKMISSPLYNIFLYSRLASEEQKNTEGLEEQRVLIEQITSGHRDALIIQQNEQEVNAAIIGLLTRQKSVEEKITSDKWDQLRAITLAHERMDAQELLRKTNAELKETVSGQRDLLRYIDREVERKEWLIKFEGNRRDFIKSQRDEEKKAGVSAAFNAQHLLEVITDQRQMQDDINQFIQDQKGSYEEVIKRAAELQLILRGGKDAPKVGADKLRGSGMTEGKREAESAYLDEQFDQYNDHYERLDALHSNLTRDHKSRLEEMGMSEQEFLLNTREGLEYLQTLNEATFGSMSDLFRAMFKASGNEMKAFWSLYKGFAIAEAIASTFVAANYAMRTNPYPYNLIAAGATVTAGLANVAKIAATEPGKAKGSSSSGGSGGGGNYYGYNDRFTQQYRGLYNAYPDSVTSLNDGPDMRMLSSSIAQLNNTISGLGSMSVNVNGELTANDRFIKTAISGADYETEVNGF